MSDRTLRTSLRISAHDLRIGMFIAELDRPWSQTPFLMQGFQLTDAAHLQSVRDFVREVTIDPLRSTADSLKHLPWDALHHPSEPVGGLTGGALTASASAQAPAWRPSALAGAPVPARTSLLSSIGKDLWRSWQARSGRPAGQQADQYYLRYAEQLPAQVAREPAAALAAPLVKAALSSSLTPPSTPQFSQFVARLYARDFNLSFGLPEAFALWRERRRKRSGRPRAARVRPARERADFLPAKMPLFVYQDRATMADEAGRAKVIVERADMVLEKLVSDIHADLPVSIAAVQPIVAVLVDSVISNPAALMWSARMRDESEKTYLHGLKVAIYMMTLGRHLGFPKEQLAELGSIGLLLDVGMLKMPTELLEKTGALSPEENQLLTSHVELSIAALEQGDPLPGFVARGILEHHERSDGSGYPRGLNGAEISVYGRMAAIADTFAAMTTARPYDVTHSAFDAMKELFREAETKLHGPLVEQFVQAISIFPVGSLIELSSGEAAIVLEHNSVRRLEPKILVLTDPEKTMLFHPYTLDLMGTNPDNKKILRGLADGAYGIDYRDYYLV